MSDRPGFLFYDLETFGTDPSRDRIAQFAAQRTTLALEPAGPPTVLFCRPSSDILPHPEACLLTGITPQSARDKGIDEWSFADHVNAVMALPDTCAVGYNSFRFDDEFVRYLFYRNALDPYAREYQHGNSRYDIIDLARLCYALRPRGIEWPRHEDGRPSFRLEDLTRVNHIEHASAHDALGDVNATIAIARLIKGQQPKLWDWALALRDKRKVADLLRHGEPLVHASSRFAASRGGVAVVLPLAPHPKIKSQYLVYDLTSDPEAFCTLPLPELHERLYTPRDELPEGVERIAIKAIKINRAPVLAPINTLHGVDHQRIELDLDSCLRNAQRLRQCSDLKARLLALFGESHWPPASDPESALYDGFISDGDKRLLSRVRHTEAEQWAGLSQQFRDQRLPELIFRARARHFSDTLSPEEQQRWQAYRYQRLFLADGGGAITVREFRQRLSTCRQEGRDAVILDALEAWLSELGVNELEQAHGPSE